MNISIKIEGLEKLGYLARQLPFATAKALTKTAQQGQEAVIKSLNSAFTLRTNWYKPSSKIGIRITPAKKNDLQSEIKTNAKFLQLHEGGMEKIPFGKFIAIPTENVRRTKRQLVAKSNYPGNLKNSFIVNSKKSGVKLLLTKVGRGRVKQTRLMYVLVPKAKIKKVSVFYEPIRRAVAANFSNNFNEAWSQAVATAK